MIELIEDVELGTRRVEAVKDKLRVELRDWGRGAQQLLFLLTAFAFNNIVIFDEPENSLHPSLISHLVSITKKFDTQFIFATHSETILDSMELTDIDSNIAIYSLKYIPNEGTQIEQIKTTDAILQLFKSLGVNIGLFRRTLFAKSKVLLITEGDEDKTIITKIFQLNSSQLDPKYFNILPLGGKGNLWKINEDALKEILEVESPLSFIVIGDRDEGISYLMTKYEKDRIFTWEGREIENVFIKFNKIKELILSKDKQKIMTIDKIFSIIKASIFDTIEKWAILLVYEKQLRPIYFSDFSKISNEPTLDSLKKFIHTKIAEIKERENTLDNTIDTIKAELEKKIAFLDTKYNDIYIKNLDIVFKDIPGKDFLQSLKRNLNERYQISFSLTDLIATYTFEELTDFVKLQTLILTKINS